VSKAVSADAALHDVLLASADLEERRLLYAELREAGYEVMAVEGIRDAVRALLLGVVRPPLVLLDLHGDPQATHKGVDDLLALLRDVPLILVADSIGNELWEPLRPRVAALLRRPIHVGEIVDAVRRISPPPGSTISTL
jgi:DNA-binding NtrC family response regulator